MKDDVIHSLAKYYQTSIPRERAKYFDTPEYHNLIDAKVNAENHPETWEKCKSELTSRFPGYTCDDNTHLGKDNGYCLQISLPDAPIPRNTPATGKTPEMQKRIHLFISALGPFFFHYLIREENENDPVTYQSTIIHTEDYPEDALEITQFINEYWEKQDYRFVDADEASEIVKDYFHEEESGKVSTFTFLFSTINAP